MSDLVNIYAGFDDREEAGYHTFVSSLLHTAKLPFHVAPINHAFASAVNGMQGSTAFAFARFLIPWVQKFRGYALFCDASDMLVRADIRELWELRDFRSAVQVVKHDYKTRHPRKFVGTQLEADNIDYPCKNWSSVMLINCAHFDWRDMTPEFAARMGNRLHSFDFIRPHMLGELPIEWNWLVDEYGPNDDAKLLHWTAGIPAFPNYANAPMADEWAASAIRARHVSP